MNHNELYSRLAKIYDMGLYLNGTKRAYDFFVKQLPFPEDKEIKVLDAGAGTGQFTLAILRRFPKAEIVAFDLNQNMIEELKITLKNKGLTNSVKTFIANASKPIPEIANNQFDLVVTCGVLEYVYPEDTIKNLASYLKPNGYFFNSPVKDNIWGKLLGTAFVFKPYSQERIIRAFTGCGFTLLRLLKIPIRYLPASLMKEGYLFGGGK
ncbi:MAG TPA: methyltransferase domain-containing protein [Thermodesulfobacteriota bacterium]|nr:methyltransferase domain-containing protein [Thermodesulfobacteriota bacterium]